METPEGIVRTPWDSKVFGIDTYEIRDYSEDVLRKAIHIPGHYTLKVDPLSSKRLLHEYGFYYCDTLIEPYCARTDFVFFEHEGASVSREVDIEAAANICRGAFQGRFHRDFNLESQRADRRYEQWLRQLHGSGTVFALVFENETAGFFGYAENRILLHALAERFRGRGLAKYLWSKACAEMFEMGYEELSSSVSASNVPIVNLYCSLGFRFRNPKDIYHKLVKGV